MQLESVSQAGRQAGRQVGRQAGGQAGRKANAPYRQYDFYWVKVVLHAKFKN